MPPLVENRPIQEMSGQTRVLNRINNISKSLFSTRSNICSAVIKRCHGVNATNEVVIQSLGKTWAVKTSARMTRFTGRDQVTK